ncbi:MAG: DMT family transporter [Candidatus Krumholzibacteriia bacterium]
MTDAEQQRRVRAALIAVQLLFGVNYLVSKQVVAVMAPAAWAALRVASSLVVLAILTALFRQRLPRGRDVWYLGGCAVLGVTFNQIFFLEGLSRTTPAHAALICSQIPLFALATAVALGRERLDVSRVAALVCGMVGVLVLLEVDHLHLDPRDLAGDLLILVSSASYGAYVALSGRVMARHDPLGATTVVFLCGSAGVMVYGLDDLLAAPLQALTAGDLARMAYVVLGATVVTYALNLYALKHTQASRVALYIFLQPVVATVLSVLVLHEAVTWRLLVAGVLVLASLTLRELSARSQGARRRAAVGEKS